MASLRHLAITAAFCGALVAPAATPAVAAVTEPRVLDRFTTQRLTWTSCGDGIPEALRCSAVTVPLDYGDPAGPTITIALSRLAASDSTRRRGALLVNRGGPGASGLLLPLTMHAAMGEAVRATYDLIGFDPRFVGRSTPVTCGLPAAERQYLLLPAQSFAADVRWQAGIAARCARSGAAQRTATTRDTARDMDVVRAVLGERRISYLGYSYGTYLGAVYTQMFGHRTDRVVLDSVVDPATVWRGMLRDFGPSLERAVDFWADQVATHAPGFLLGTTGAQVRATYTALLARAQRSPVPVEDGHLSGQDLRALTVAAMYHEGYLPRLADLVRVAVHGGRLLPDTRDWLAGQYRPGGDGATDDNPTAAQLAIFCGDVAWPRDLTRYRRDKVTDARRYPLFGATYSTVKPCAFWPARPAEPPTRIGPDNRAASILLVQSTADVATPHRNAVRVRHLLARNSRLLTVDGMFHPAYLFAESRCVDEQVESYLLSGRLPDGDHFCARDMPGAAPTRLGPSLEAMA